MKREGNIQSTLLSFLLQLSIPAAVSVVLYVVSLARLHPKSSLPVPDSTSQSTRTILVIVVDFLVILFIHGLFLFQGCHCSDSDHAQPLESPGHTAHTSSECAQSVIKGVSEAGDTQC